MYNLSDTIERKFTEVILISDWEIETDSGWEDISFSNKTIPYKIWKIELSNGYILECADTHIVFDSDYNEVFVKDLSLGSNIITDSGPITVVSISESDIEEEMYDLSVESDNHRFYSNGILSHNSTSSVAYMLWYILFNESKTVAILANKGVTARLILSKLRLAYEHLPHWLQGGIITWNKGSIELDNGSIVIAESTTGSAIRGNAISFLFLDEYAFIPPTQAADFFESVYPTISSGNETRIAMVSTPKGLNHFYKAWIEATEGRSEFVPFEINWSDVPGRNQAWKEKTIANIGEDSWAQEFEAQFLGSSGTLITGQVLKTLVYQIPVSQTDKLKIYEQPQPGRIYAMTVDCGEGVGIDATAVSVFDITALPYKQVATWKDNKTHPLFMPDIIVGVAKKFNDAHILVEINSSGAEVANLINYELDYPNLMMVGSDKKGQVLGFGGVNTQTPGLRTTKASKRIGCTNIKDLIENGKLVITDFDTISELSTFIRKGTSYQADELCHDDMVMTLVIFGWMATQEYFLGLNDLDIRQELHAQRIKEFEENALPFIHTIQHLKEEEERIEMGGVIWRVDSHY